MISDVVGDCAPAEVTAKGMSVIIVTTARARGTWGREVEVRTA